MKYFKGFSILIIFIISAVQLSAQDKTSELRKAIAYYQQNNFEKSISIFDELVAQYPDDINIVERRGFVCCKYIQAIDAKKVEASSERYQEIVIKGKADLKKSVEENNNNDNKPCLEMLEKK